MPIWPRSILATHRPDGADLGAGPLCLIAMNTVPRFALIRNRARCPIWAQSTPLQIRGCDQPHPPSVTGRWWAGARSVWGRATEPPRKPGRPIHLVTHRPRSSFLIPPPTVPAASGPPFFAAKGEYGFGDPIGMNSPRLTGRFPPPLTRQLERRSSSLRKDTRPASGQKRATLRPSRAHETWAWRLIRG